MNDSKTLDSGAFKRFLKRLLIVVVFFPALLIELFMICGASWLITGNATELSFMHALMDWSRK